MSLDEEKDEIEEKELVSKNCECIYTLKIVIYGKMIFINDYICIKNLYDKFLIKFLARDRVISLKNPFYRSTLVCKRLKISSSFLYY